MLKKGFTLIELLVVGAIILIMLAIIYPVIDRVRNGGKTDRVYNGQHAVIRDYSPTPR